MGEHQFDHFPDVDPEVVMDVREVMEVAAPDTLPLERLEAELTEWAGHLAAAECRWIQLIAEYDRREGWTHWGCHSIVQWLGWHCGLGGRAARERARVGRALRDLPQITAEFAAGRLSYSKVRALTRIATPMNEADVVVLAEHATASQVDRIVSAYRGVLTVEEEIERANRQVAEQHLRSDWEDDGSMAIHRRMPSEVGALLLKALEAARRELCADARGEGGPAGPVHRPERATNIDALQLIAESFLEHGAASRDGSDRYLMIVNVDEDVLVRDDPSGVCELDGGPALAPEAARRLACDASTVAMIRRADGSVLGASDKTRTISRRLRRLVHARDRGCRFPGCGARRFVDVHHVRHRAHGGTNALDNLIELCWFHHRLVHEDGWRLRLDDAGEVVVTNPTGNVIPAMRARCGAAVAILDRNARAGLTIEPTAITPRWYGDPLDLDHVTTALVRRPTPTEPELTGSVAPRSRRWAQELRNERASEYPCCSRGERSSRAFARCCARTPPGSERASTRSCSARLVTWSPG